MFSDYFATRKSGPKKDTTCWNRRSNAASFSTYFLYSSKVVAPMHRSWPRASIGFKRFAASIDPSVRPNQSTNQSQSCKIHLQFVLLLEWQIPDQEMTTAIKLQFCTSTGMRSSWSRKENTNQGAVCTATGMRTSWSRKIWSLCCSWNEIQFLIKKRLAVCATTLGQEVLDQEKTTEIKFAVSKCYWNEKILMKKKNRNLVCSLQCCAWNEKFLIKKKLLTVDPFHWCFSYLNKRFMSKHQKERST